jgi:hypothetical protein
MDNSNDKFLLLAFLYRPAHSMRQLLDSGRGHGTALLVATLFGIMQISRVLPIPVKSEPEELLLYLALYVSCGIAGLFLFGWLVRNFGRWFGAETEQRRVRTALGLGMLPWTLLFAALLLAQYCGLDTELIEYFPVFLGTFIYGFCILLLSLTAGLRLGIIKTFLCIIVTTLFGLIPLVYITIVLVNYLN